MIKSKTINLYTVKFLGLGWLFEVINAAFKISNKKDNNFVKIILLDEFEESTFKNIIKFYLYKNKEKISFLNLKKINKKFKFNPKSIDSRLLLNKKVNFKYKNFNFEIESVKVNFILNNLLKIFSLFICIFYFFKILIFSNKKDFLKFKFQNIQIGDLVASTYLRMSPSRGGKFGYSFALFKIFFYSFYYSLKSNFIINKYENHSKKSYTIIPEPIYLQCLWVRKFLSLGIPNIDINHYKKKFYIKKKINKINTWIADKKKIKKINNKDKLLIKNYFKTRFKNPGKIMSYLTAECSNDNSKNIIYNFQNKKIYVHKNQLIAVVFLHSFDDAQYCFGLDDFEDIYDWTIFSIDKCLKNNYFDKVFIKPHPGTDLINYPGDGVALKKIQEKYKKNPRVEILKKNTSVVYLSKSTNILGITHHGSIAEELTFLNKNVIASVNGPWSSHYKFLATWKNKNEYGIYLNKFNKMSLRKPSPIELNEFYNYILERKMNLVESKDHSIRLFLSKTKQKYNKWQNPKIELRGFNNYVKDLKNFENNDIFINDLIKPIYNRIYK